MYQILELLILISVKKDSLEKLNHTTEKYSPAGIRDIQGFLSAHLNTIFLCASCCGAKLQKLLTFTKHKNSSFVVDQGFGSWNKAIETFNDHEKRKCIKRL